MQLDTEEGETFVPPAGVVASPSAKEPPANPNSAIHDSESLDTAEATQGNDE